jgi:hypothetical protein
VNLAIECIALLAKNVTQDPTKLFRLAEMCYNPLVEIATRMEFEPTCTPAMSARFLRSLVVLGYVCEHSRKCSDLMEQLAQSIMGLKTTEKELIRLNLGTAKRHLSKAEKINPATIYGSSYSAVLFALGIPIENIQVRAVKALCGVFAGYPQLMSQANEDGLFPLIFSESYSEAVHERFLNGLKEMMVADEVSVRVAFISTNLIAISTYSHD